LLFSFLLIFLWFIIAIIIPNVMKAPGARTNVSAGSIDAGIT
jgi:hypothetical protein